MNHAVRRDVLVMVIWAAVTAASFLLLGDSPVSWGLAILGGTTLGQLRSQRQTRRRYAVRHQFECRVRLPSAATPSRRRWMRALATPYPDRITLQLLAGGTTSSDDPVVVRPANLAGLRKARAAESLFRFSPAWQIAAFRGGHGEVLVAAPSSFLTALTGSSSTHASEHLPDTPRGRPEPG